MAKALTSGLITEKVGSVCAKVLRVLPFLHKYYFNHDNDFKIDSCWATLSINVSQLCKSFKGLTCFHRLFIYSFQQNFCKGSPFIVLFMSYLSDLSIHTEHSFFLKKIVRSFPISKLFIQFNFSRFFFYFSCYENSRRVAPVSHPVSKWPLLLSPLACQNNSRQPSPLPP